MSDRDALSAILLLSSISKYLRSVALERITAVAEFRFPDTAKKIYPKVEESPSLASEIICRLFNLGKKVS